MPDIRTSQIFINPIGNAFVSPFSEFTPAVLYSSIAIPKSKNADCLQCAVLDLKRAEVAQFLQQIIEESQSIVDKSDYFTNQDPIITEVVPIIPPLSETPEEDPFPLELKVKFTITGLGTYEYVIYKNAPDVLQWEWAIGVDDQDYFGGGYDLGQMAGSVIQLSFNSGSSTWGLRFTWDDLTIIYQGEGVTSISREFPAGDFPNFNGQAINPDGGDGEPQPGEVFYFTSVSIEV